MVGYGINHGRIEGSIEGEECTYCSVMGLFKGWRLLVEEIMYPDWIYEDDIETF